MHVVMYNVNDMLYFRRIYWEDNMKFISEHNERYDRGEITFYLGENEFSDMVRVRVMKRHEKRIYVPFGVSE